MVIVRLRLAKVIDHKTLHVGLHRIVDKLMVIGVHLIGVSCSLVHEVHGNRHGKAIVHHATCAGNRAAGAEVFAAGDVAKLAGGLEHEIAVFAVGLIQPENNNVGNHAAKMRHSPANAIDLNTAVED